MAHYNDGTLYDSGALYDQGAKSYTARLAWGLTINWGGTQVDESARLMSASIERGIQQYTNGSGDGLQDINPGRLTIVLDNRDRRYDPYNSSSALYPNVTNMTPITLTVMDTSNGTVYPVFAGTIDDIRPHGALDKRATLTATDDIEALRQQTATTDLLFGITASDAIKEVAESVGISGGSYQASAHPLTVFGVENQNALQLCADLTEASLGQLFVDRSGRLTYYDLSYSSMTSHNLDEDNVDKEIVISQPWDERYPSIGVYANRWARTSEKTLWDYGGNLKIPASSSVTVRAEWNEIGVPSAPVGNKDYLTIPYISAPGVMTNALNATLSDITPRSALITVTNVSPWIQSTYLRLRGREYVTGLIISDRRYQPGAKISGRLSTTQTSTKQLYTDEDTTLEQKRRYKFVLDNEWLQDGNFADAYSTLLKDHLKSGLKTIRITFSSAASIAQQFGMELFDKVVFTAGTLGVNGTYYLGGIRHDWQAPEVGEVNTELTLIQLLKSSTTITPEPPVELPPDFIDDDDGTDNDGNPVLPPDNSPDCTVNYQAPANGPYPVSGFAGKTIYNYGPDQTAAAYFPCIIRPLGSTYVTTFSATIKLEETFDGGKTWVMATSASDVSVLGLNSAGVSNVTSTLTTSTPTYIAGYFIPATWINVQYLAIQLAEGTPVYLLGGLLASGSVAANKSAATLAFTGLTPGGLYAIESSGQFDTGPGTGYGIDINLDGNTTWYDDTAEGPILYREFTANGNNWRLFFIADAGGAVYVRASDSVYSDNSGTISWSLSEATYAGTRRCLINSFSIANICPASGGGGGGGGGVDG